ncbi:putative dna topoisomerase [Diaporthe ampelina]|uniref:DNA topoisomerase n=1 Tax=Diaporthe ampelina TaxID=1214573 RepID=A0A0G2I809_9PEZI|nr:putative dna topoisomerase [Diaporthe ampelina]
MTAVTGHLTSTDFNSGYKNWSYPPPVTLFGAPITTFVSNDKGNVAKNIEEQARYCRALFIWTDCDREGEHIGGEIRDAAKKGNPQIVVKRAQFSNIERAFLTNSLRSLGGPIQNSMISYGSCQFPTLGFVVDRYFKVQNFVPENFWGIKVTHKKDGVSVTFNWERHRLFDRAAVTILYERCLSAKQAKVVKVQEKPTKKWKPLPLTTVELQKMATRFLRMTGQQALNVAETLYQRGFISYPRTETDQFDKGMNLRELVRKQTQDNRWGQFAQDLVDNSFQQPRNGRHNDKAHPPIHPITYAAPSVLNDQEKSLYEFVTRRFLACCSEDAKGTSTDVDILYGDEGFHAHGVIVLERNYLDVYPYENWTNTAELPNFTLGEVFEPAEAMMTEGKTTPPGYLTEADLLSLMDANGIGTDATMSEHIEKIQMREYVQAVDRAQPAGFDSMNFETSLSKPFLRKEMEIKMKAICEGRSTKEEFLRDNLQQFRAVFDQSTEQVDVLKAACRRYMFQGAVG